MILSAEYVRQYVRDYVPTNYLLDGVQFDDAQIFQAQTLALDFFNVMTPITNYDETTFPSKVLLLLGTLWHLFNGAAAQAARNTMSYSDAGLQIPIEERFEMYSLLARQYKEEFSSAAQNLKIQLNVQQGWSFVPSDYARMPSW